MRRCVALLLLLALAAPARGADAPVPGAPPPSPEVAAAAVVRAVGAKDEAALRALGGADVPDPWLVADELLRRSEHDAAAEFAKAALRPDTEALPAYVGSRRGKADDPARRSRLAGANAAMQAGRPEEALEAVGPPEEGPAEDVLAVRLRNGRAAALAALGRPRDATAAFQEAAESAERLGWLARAASMLDTGARVAFETGAPAAALPFLERLRKVEERRGDRVGQAKALSGKAQVLGATGDRRGAIEAAETALSAWEATGDVAMTASAAYDLGSQLIEGGEHARAVEVLTRAGALAERAGNQPLAAGVQLAVGVAEDARGDPAKALAAWEKARVAFEALGDPGGQAAALVNLGKIHTKPPFRDPPRAQLLLEQGAGMAEGVGARDIELVGRKTLARFLAECGDGPRAKAAFERSIELYESLGDEAGLAGELIDAGVQFAQDRIFDAATALTWLERGLPMAKALRQPRWAANAYLGMGDVHAARDDAEKALAAYEQAIASAREAGECLVEAGACLGMGGVYTALGETEKALGLLQDAMSLAQSLGEPMAAASAMARIGSLYTRRRSFPEALAAYQRALDLAAPLGKPAQSAAFLRSMGFVQYQFGELPKALASYRRAMTLCEEAKDEFGIAYSLLGLGVIHRNLGEYAKSLEAAERANAILKDLGDRGGAAMALCNIGVVYADIGDLAKAMRIYEQALPEHDAVHDRRSHATTLGNIATMHMDLGDPAKALPIFEKVVEEWEALQEPVRAASTRASIGDCLLEAGEPSKALEVTTRALADLEALGAKQEVTRAQMHLAKIHSRSGNPAKAVQVYERLLRGAEKLGTVSTAVEALKHLSKLRLDLGDTGRAMSDAHRAVTMLDRLVGGLGEEQGATARGEFTELFSTGRRAAAKAGDAAEAAFFLESGRAGSLLESLGARDQLRWAGLPEELKHAEADARAEEAQALVAYTRALDGADREAIQAKSRALDEAREKVAEVVERIQREAKKEAQLWYPVATPIEDIQASLAAGEVLVLYGLSTGEEEAHALVLTRSDARIVGLGPTRAVVEACEALDARDPAVDPTAALAALREVLIRPIALPEGTKRVLVSPDGALGYVPFAALLPDLPVAFEASGTTYELLLKDRTPTGTRVLALADPDYGAKFDPTALELYARKLRAGAARQRGPGLSPLPGTRAEAEAIADVKLLGKDASEAGLRQAIGGAGARWRAVHFACHGLVNPDRPTLSSLALTPDAANDGFLTALEVLRMQIPADLVVLSACETGRGKIAGGEGIVGLTRAFMFAGSPRVLCSLWKVDDDATRALMTRFYELWHPRDGTPGLSAAEALRKAQDHIRSQEKWKHPYYWAAWVLWGLPS